MNSEKIVALIVGGLGVLVGGSALAILCAWPIMLLWNWLMPSIFGLKTITLWQALGLNILSMFLFKGSGSSSK
jgi:hypothetical protein